MTDHRASPTDEEIAALLDKEVDGTERARLAERVLADREARARLDADARIKRALREEIAGFDPDPASYALEAEALASMTRREPRVGWQVALAGVALLATGWGGRVGYELWSEWQVPPMVEEAAQAHQVFAHDRMRPVETADAGTLTEWFSVHVGAPVTIPDLRPAGLRFVGGRLLSSEQGALAQMIYEDPLGQRLSLYLAEDTEDDGEDLDREPEMEIVRLDEVDAGYWREGGVTYAVVAETSVEQVIAVATAIGVAADSSKN